MRPFRVIMVAVVSLFAACAHAAAPEVTAELSASASLLAGEAYANGQSYALLTTLSDELGPRLSGSANYERAVRWAVDRFHAMGIASVHLEPVVLKHGWQRGSAHAVLLGAVPRVLHVAAYGWTPPTAKGGLRAPVVALRDITDAGVTASHVAGAIVLIDRQALIGPQAFHPQGPDDYELNRLSESLDARLQASGAVAALVYSKSVNQVLRTSSLSSGGDIMRLPAASIGREDALLILRTLTRGAVELELHLDSVVTGPVTVENVIAEIPGRDSAAEVVMLGAHLDSWDLGTGAQDNGSGVAEVMDVARALAALPHAPRRTVRVALWAAEEQGLNGSNAYVRAHAAEMQAVVAYLNTDTGAGRPLGWDVNGRRDLEPALQPLSALLARIGGSAITSDVGFDTDSGGFFLAGVPTLDLALVEDDYDPIVHHKPADTLDKVDTHDLAAATAMLAVTAYALAEAPARPAPHLSRAEVEALLRGVGALEYVRSSDMKDLLPD